jgi:hypothetical protein
LVLVAFCMSMKSEFLCNLKSTKARFIILVSDIEPYGDSSCYYNLCSQKGENTVAVLIICLYSSSNIMNKCSFRVGKNVAYGRKKCFLVFFEIVDDCRRKNPTMSIKVGRPSFTLLSGTLLNTHWRDFM